MIGILAIGNELRGDDGVGLFAGGLLESQGFDVVFAHESPENIMGKLLFKKIIILDAAHFEEEAPFLVGDIDYGGYSHKIGFSKIAKFTGAKIRVIGIKTYNRELGESISEAAKRNAMAAVKVVKMCMAIPGVVSDAENKLVDFGGKIKKSKFAVPGLKKGDFVLVHAGVVIEKLKKEDYENAKSALDFSDDSCNL
ncbi:MAG: hypothetical protein GOV01_00660 [Candidatus Altiarchaeota archaeon]|nr:hypothetical protein [Candidatus Altiarchaeota archaeon]